jgi:hypothetical protein
MTPPHGSGARITDWTRVASCYLEAPVPPPDSTPHPHSGPGTTLLFSDVNDGLSIDFRGGLIWLVDWNIWSETTEAVGLAVLEAARISANAPPVDAAPAQLFDPGEMLGAQIALGLPLLFGWDA